MKHFSAFGSTDIPVCARIDAMLQTFCTDKSLCTTNVRFNALFKLFPVSK
jgi:hypothetical protein